MSDEKKTPKHEHAPRHFSDRSRWEIPDDAEHAELKAWQADRRAGRSRLSCALRALCRAGDEPIRIGPDGSDAVPLAMAAMAVVCRYVRAETPLSAGWWRDVATITWATTVRSPVDGGEVRP
jgi:hypothetical protein